MGSRRLRATRKQSGYKTQPSERRAGHLLVAYKNSELGEPLCVQFVGSFELLARKHGSGGL